MSEVLLRARLQFVVDDPGAWGGARLGVQQLGQTFGQLRTEVTANTVTQAAFLAGMRRLGSMAKSVASEFGQFELTLKRAQGVLGGMTPDLERMRRFAMFSRETEFSANQLAQGMLELARAGSEGAETLRDIKLVADVATVAEYDLKRASIAVANAQQAWGGNLISSRQLMEKFVNAANASTFELGNLIQAMGLAQGAALSYDQTLTTTLVSLSILAPITGANTKAGTAFAAALRSIADAKKQLKLKGLGIELTDNLTGGFRQIPYIIADFIEKTSKMSTEKGAAMTKAIFGERGTRDVAAIMRVMERGVVDINGQFVTGRQAIDAWYEKIEKGKLSLSEQAGLVRESLPMRWQKLKTNVQRMFIEIGEKLAPLLKTLIGAFQTLAGAVEYVFSSKLGYVLAFAGGLATVGAALAGIGFVLRTLNLRAVFGGLTAQAAALAAGGAGGAGAGGPGLPMVIGSGGAAGPGAAGYLAGGLLHGRNAPLDERFAAWRATRNEVAVTNSARASLALRQGGSLTAAAGRGALAVGARVASGGLALLGGVASALTSPLSLLIGGFYAASEAIDYFRKRAAKQKEKEEKYSLIAENFDNVALAIGEMYKNKGGITGYRAQQLESTPMLKWALGAALENIGHLQERRAAGYGGQVDAMLKKAGFQSEAQYGVASVASALRQRMIKEDVPKETQQILLDRFERHAEALGLQKGKTLALTRAKQGEAGVNVGDLGKDDPSRGVLLDLARLGRSPMDQFAGVAEMGSRLKNQFFQYGTLGGIWVEVVKGQMLADQWTPEAVKQMQDSVMRSFVDTLRSEGSIDLKVDSANRIIGGTLKFLGKQGVAEGSH